MIFFHTNNRINEVNGLNQELKNIIQMIEKGKSNAEIINFRIKYLTTDDYKRSNKNIIFDKERVLGTNIILGDSNNIVFKECFIDKDMIITHRNYL